MARNRTKNSWPLNQQIPQSDKNLATYLDQHLYVMLEALKCHGCKTKALVLGDDTLPQTTRTGPCNHARAARYATGRRMKKPRFVAPGGGHPRRDLFLGAVAIGGANSFTPQWGESVVVDRVAGGTWLKGAAPPIAYRKKAFPSTSRGMMRRGECAKAGKYGGGALSDSTLILSQDLRLLGRASRDHRCTWGGPTLVLRRGCDRLFRLSVLANQEVSENPVLT